MKPSGERLVDDVIAVTSLKLCFGLVQPSQIQLMNFRSVVLRLKAATKITTLICSSEVAGRFRHIEIVRILE